MIKYEVLPNAIRFILPYSIFYIAEEDFLDFQHHFKEACFEFCKQNGKKLGGKKVDPNSASNS